MLVSTRPMAGRRDPQPYAAAQISTPWDDIGPICFRTVSGPHRKRAKFSDECTIDGSGLATPADSTTRKSTCSEDLDERSSQDAQERLDHESIVYAGAIPITDLETPVESTVSETVAADLPDIQPQPQPAPRGDTSGIPGLYIYHREVDRSVTDRFDDVSKQLEPALAHYLHKKRVEFRPLAIQLLVLGATEETAKPCMVVLCPASANKKVKRFFCKDFAVRICQGPPNCQIRFDTHVVGRSLKTLGRETPDEVFMEEDCPAFANTWTPQIRVIHKYDWHYATMGGFVCVTEANDRKSFYGLTVGHILPPDQEIGADVLEALEDSSGPESSDTESESDSISFCSDDEENHSERADFHIVEKGHPFPKLNVECRSTHVKPEARRQWASLGTMSSASYSSRARDRDWALTHITAVQHGQTKVLNFPFRLLRIPVRPAGDQHAVIDNKTTIPCEISALPARVLLASGHNFVDVKVLRIHGDEKPAKGASGSWVVSYDLQMRVLVYGMLIATDPFGNLWMMPTTDILADIHKEMGATDVHLASHDEIPIQSQVSGPAPTNLLPTQKATLDTSTYFTTAARADPKFASRPGPSKEPQSKALRWEEFSKRFL